MQKMKSSAKPKKQRRTLFQAANHERHKHFSAHLSAELRKLYDTRTLPIRRGDTVRIMRGDHKGFEGKVSRVDRKKYRVYAEGLTREKVDGTTIFVPTHPSKTMLINLNVEDKWRKQILERKKGIQKATERVAEKPKTEEATEVEAPVKEQIQRKRRKKRAARKPAEKKAERGAKKPKKVTTSRRRQAPMSAKTTEKKRPDKRKRAKKPKEEK